MYSLDDLSLGEVFGDTSQTKSSEVFLIDGNNYIRFMYQNYTSGNTMLNSFLDNFAISYPEAKWFWDGEGYKEIVQAVYPAYKSKRKYNDDPQFTMFRKKLVEHPSVRYGERIAGVEADTQIRDYILQSGLTEAAIFSSDADLLQLKKYGNFKFPYVKLDNPFRNMKPHHLCVYKVLVGDSSDNIGGLKGFGKKAFDKLSETDLDEIYYYFTTGEFRYHRVDEKLMNTIVFSEELKTIFNIVHL